jgi:hypothetical protein
MSWWQNDQEKTRSTVAKLLFIATHARPDILIATNFLCGRAEKYTPEDLEKLQRVLRYLKGCPNDGITLRGEQDLTITAYADASFGTHAEDCLKSHSGLVVKVGSSSIVMKTNKQKLVTKSSCEAELVSASDAIPMVCYIRDWLKEKGLIAPEVKLLQDNMSTISLITNEVQGSMRPRHIGIRYFFIRDRVKSGEISVEYCPTRLMIADLLTKSLEGILFQELKTKILGMNAPELKGSVGEVAAERRSSGVDDAGRSIQDRHSIREAENHHHNFNIGLSGSLVPQPLERTESSEE